MKLIVRTLVKEKIYEEKLKNTEKIKGTFSLEYFNVYPEVLMIHLKTKLIVKYFDIFVKINKWFVNRNYLPPKKYFDRVE